MEDGSWKREGPPEMMVTLDSARQWLPREKLVACNADHTQIAKLKRGENSIYPSVKFAIKQAMLSAGDLYNEAKSKQNEIMGLRASYDAHPETRLSGPYPAESTLTEALISPASEQSQEAVETNQRSFTLNSKHNVYGEYGEREAHRLSPPLDTAVLDWQRDVEEHNKANGRSHPSFADQTETETKSNTNDKHFSRSQSQESSTSFGLGIEELSVSSIPETLSSGPGGPSIRKEPLSSGKLAGGSVNGSGEPVPVSYGVSGYHDTSHIGLIAKVLPSMSLVPETSSSGLSGEEFRDNPDKLAKGNVHDNDGPVLDSERKLDHHDAFKSNPSTELPSGREQSNNKSNISADNVTSNEDDELTKAIKEGNEQKTRELLNLNYAINRRSKCDHGATPLITATKFRQQNLVRFLLEQGASTTARDNDGNTTLHFLTIATNDDHDNIRARADENILELLLEKQPPLEIPNNDGKTPLLSAARNGQKFVLEKLILSGANVTATDPKGWTALHYAARYARCPELITILAKAGAAVNARTTQPSRKTPLHLVGDSPQNSAEVTERLIAAGAHMEALTQYKHTPLHIAIMKNNCACVAQLLKLGANVRAAAFRGFTPLHTAAENCKSSTDIVEHLLQARANVEARNDGGNSPLHIAVRNDNIICVIHLLEHGADIQARECLRWTPLHYAACYGLLPIVKLLLERGANPCAKHSPPFGGRPSSMVGDSAPNLAPNLDASTKREIKETLKKAEKAWKASGKK